MSYKLQDKGSLSDDQRANVLERLTDFHRENNERYLNDQKTRSANSLIRELESSGHSYRRKDLLDDIRRTGVSYRARDTPAMERAQRFYDNVLEPIRKEYGVSQKEALKIWGRIKEQDYKTLVEAERFAEIFDMYRS